MYPLKFKNVYHEKIWGGRDFEDFRNNLPDGKIGESWDIACHENGMSVVSEGEFKGKTLQELINVYGEKLVGKNVDTSKFPLLVKLINSQEKLSVQVHPGDNYAKLHENSLGKTEAWYVVDAIDEAYLVIGTKNCTKKDFENAIKDGKTEGYLNKVKVQKGDCFLINSGLVHAICEGVIIAEIQQNSDITYRIYDYGRPREIHIEKSLDVIDFSQSAVNLGNTVLNKYSGFYHGILCEAEYFTIEKYIVDERVELSSDINRFSILTCVDGNGVIMYENGSMKIEKGDSILIPAQLGNYIVEGKLTFLKSYSL